MTHTSMTDIIIAGAPGGHGGYSLVPASLSGEAAVSDGHTDPDAGEVKGEGKGQGRRKK